MVFIVKALMDDLVGAMDNSLTLLYVAIWKDCYSKKIRIFLWSLVWVPSILLIVCSTVCRICVFFLHGVACVTNMLNLLFICFSDAPLLPTFKTLFFLLLVGLLFALILLSDALASLLVGHPFSSS